MSAIPTPSPVRPAPLGFIGLGVMGEPMCRNLARKSGRPVLAHDLRPEPLARLAADGVRAAPDLAAVAREAEIIFLSLPSGAEVEAVVAGPDGLVERARAGQIVVDMSTSPVPLMRRLAEALAQKGACFADAPVARTRRAATEGTLAITVGAKPETFAAIEPLLAFMGTEITHCGPVGAGQTVKLMNNMVLFTTVLALAEAMAIAARAGVEEATLLDALSHGSADSFALRNHAMKAMLPRDFPADAFSTDYALKDLRYAIELAREAGIDPQSARLASDVLACSSAAGQGPLYFPALLRIIADEL